MRERVLKVKVYSWIGENKSNSGSEYPQIVKVSHRGYEMIRDNIKKTYPYAGYKIVEGIGQDNKKLKIFIK